MDQWIQILVAFVNDDKTYDFGTKAIDEYKALTPDMKIEVKKDARYEELKALGKLFAREV